MLFETVAAEEIAFAMTLFVSAANGQTAVGAGSANDEQSGQQFFCSLAEPDAQARETLLESSLFRAFRAVWQQYLDDARRQSISARILGFCFLMERTRGGILQAVHTTELPAPASTAFVVLHPAVVEAVAVVELTPAGVVTAPAFLAALEGTARNHADLAVPVPSVAPELAVPREWPRGAGETPALMRARDWSRHPLGEPDAWPQSLRTAIELTLASSFPMIVLWGAELTQFYNDAYRNIMGVKHPAGLGQSTAACWPEVWPFNQPVYARVLLGESLTFEDQLFPITRYGYLEDAYFTLCYSPLRVESDAIGGVFVTVFETTRRVRSGMTRGSGAERDEETGQKSREVEWRGLEWSGGGGFVGS